MAKLSEEEIKGRLTNLEGWKREGDSISRTWEFPRFLKAIEFIQKVARLADEMEHHPDIFNHWRTVTLSLTTHDEGGLTERDFRLADKINGIALD